MMIDIIALEGVVKETSDKNDMSKMSDRDLEIIEHQAYAAKTDNATFVEAVTPDTVLKLISTVRELETERNNYKKIYKQIKVDWMELASNVHRLARSI